MKSLKISVLKYIPVLLLSALLAFLLYWRWQVGMTRFFDVDEFTHLHWAANFVRGQHLYVDFFTFFTPPFYWLFGIIIAFFPFNPAVFIAARVAAFIIFLGILGMLGWLFAVTRSKNYFLIPVIILAFLPMPYDKFLEVRPDNISILFAVGGMVMQIIALQKINRSRLWWFLSGILYMLSFLVLVKQLPFMVIGGFITLLYMFWGRGERVKRIPEEVLAWCAGLFIPFFVLALWLLTLGNISTVWYSLTKLAFEANMMSRLGWMEPNLFFFPNGSFYGGTTLITSGLLINHGLWILGIVFGAYRCITVFITAGGDRRRVLIEALIAGVFVVSILGYVQFFPLKHSQYLIPIAVFIAYYCADAIVLLFSRIGRIVPFFGVFILILIGSYYLGRATVEVNQVKLGWSNTVQLEQMKLLIQTIAPQDEVFDLEGRLLFWKDAYYICCLPFGSFVQYLSHKPPLLRDVLEYKKTPYIFQGDSNRLSLLSGEDLNYIRANYTPVPGWGESFWKRKP
jgi:hypothetical protein